MTLNLGLEVIQGHWNWHRSISRIRVPEENCLTPGDILRISATFLHRQKLVYLDYRTVETTWW